ncbi:MAG: T9SS type A sorting domain-containing protein [Bacteroidia bacterium]|nr:T9SS type A sorting domain-containing protein [Bacteroidia bacterium]
MKQTLTTLILLAGLLVATRPALAQGCNNSSSSQQEHFQYQSYDAANYVPALKVTTRAFPNPSTGLFTLSLQGNRDWSQAGTAEVVDLAGHVILTLDIPANERTWEAPIDLSNQRPGMYVVRIRNCASCKPVQLIVTSEAQP